MHATEQRRSKREKAGGRRKARQAEVGAAEEEEKAKRRLAPKAETERIGETRRRHMHGEEKKQARGGSKAGKAPGNGTRLTRNGE